MAGGFLRALAKMKLVELDEAEQKRADKAPAPEMSMAEIDRIIAEEEREEAARKAAAGAPKGAPAPAAAPRGPAQAAAPRAPVRQGPQAPAPAAAPVAASAPRAPSPPVQTFAAPQPVGGVGAATGIAEGRPLDEYYGMASVPPSPYPAEKLLRVIDGLRALDPNTRKAAVVAMDAADDAWSIADVVLDAQRKIAVLTESQRRLEHDLTAIGETARVEKGKLDAYLGQATETIRAKIAELEHKLQSETADVTAHKARLDAQVETATASCAREVARLQIERDRLQEICSTFVVERRG